MKQLKNFKLKIVGEEDLNRFRKFVWGEISRREAYPTTSEILLEGIVPLFYQMEVASMAMDIALGGLRKAKVI